MGNSNFPVLKGQHNLAQGIALGLKTGKSVVRHKMVTKEKFTFRTKEIIYITLQKNAVLFRPKEGFCLEKNVIADGLMLYSQNPGRCPGLLYIGPSGHKKI